jgi:hypothetical protein
MVPGRIVDRHWILGEPDVQIVVPAEQTPGLPLEQASPTPGIGGSPCVGGSSTSSSQSLSRPSQSSVAGDRAMQPVCPPVQVDAPFRHSPKTC